MAELPRHRRQIDDAGGNAVQLERADADFDIGRELHRGLSAAFRRRARQPLSSRRSKLAVAWSRIVMSAPLSSTRVTARPLTVAGMKIWLVVEELEWNPAGGAGSACKAPAALALGAREQAGGQGSVDFDRRHAPGFGGAADWSWSVRCSIGHADAGDHAPVAVSARSSWPDPA